MAMNMKDLIGRGVKINRGGPDSVEGTLMDVRWDYMVVHCKEGLVYVNESHVKSITDTGRSCGAKESMQNSIRSNNFLGVMQSLRFQRVQINRGGPEKLEGVLADADQNQLVLTLKNQEVVRIPLYHVKSVSVLGGGNKNNNSSQENNNQSQGKQSKDNNSKDNNSKDNNSKDNNSKGNNSKGNNSKGNNSKGSNSKGNNSKGNNSKGNNSKGNNSKGNNSKGR